MEERIIRRLMHSVTCKHCGHNYSGDSIKVLGKNNGLWYLNAYCPTCRTQYIIAVTVCEGKNLVVTDLTDEELARIRNRPLPTADDVLDMHCFLKSFDGNFLRLFRRQRVG
jgi:hypothetical protein